LTTERRIHAAAKNSVVLPPAQQERNGLAGDERPLKILLDDTRLPKVQKSRHDFEGLLAFDWFSGMARPAGEAAVVKLMDYLMSSFTMKSSSSAVKP
jgi:hypothetical protein